MIEITHEPRVDTAPQVTVRAAAEPTAVDGGLLSPRTALIIAGAGVEVWLACTDPMVGGAVAGGVGVAYLLHRLLRRT